MFNFSRKDTEYFDLFLENAKYFHLGAVLLDEVIKDPNKALERIDEILGLEAKADEVNEKIMEKLNLAFITPIDREDIYMIARELDNGVDLLQGTLQRLIMSRAGHATPKCPTLTNWIVESTNELVKAFKLFNDIKKNQREILDACAKVREYESKADLVYREEVGILYDDATRDPANRTIHLIKWKNILEDLEETQDHCNKLGNVLRGGVMKYA
ncbi:MAG: DUF47 family protein [Selenomonadaceae bacterium]|nr:DUF47 family protein [Selenomonadaceae bacterium]